ncbi:MAG: CotH kinase family protein [Myxococcota bacterium]
MPCRSFLALVLLAGCGPSPKPATDDSADTGHGDTGPVDTTDTEPPDDTAPDDTAPVEPGAIVRISEVMSDNSGALDAADGTSPDWIELYNPGPDPVDLAGWTLADGGASGTLAGTLGGGAFVVVFASGDGAGEGELHVPFKIDAAGETITLARPDGSVADEVDVPALPEDVSWGFAQDVVTTTLATDGTPARLGTDAPAGWTAPAFDDTAWAAVLLGVGFDGGATDATPGNVALDKPATQSSEWGGYPAGYAADGVPGTFTHTATGDFSPWWEVDLEADHVVSAVALSNRLDCCGERLYNVVVTALDADGLVVWSSDVLNPVAADATPTNPGDRFTFEVTPPVIARTVRVSKTAVGGTYSSEWLTLVDVDITGTPASPYASAITTDIAGAPAYVRAPYTLAVAPTRATLTVAYDDGFAAWIDGVPVASANDGGTFATAAHDGATAEVFVLDPRAFAAGPGVFALAGLNVAADDDDLLLRPTLVAETITDGDPAYFDTPTPGAPNGAGFAGFVDAPIITPARGFYDAAFTATLTAPPGATLVYTTDGSAPTLDHGTVVAATDAGAVTERTVSTTALLRAATFRDGYAASDIVTHTYLFLADVVQQPAAPAGLPAVWDSASEEPVSGDYEMDPEVVDADPAAIIEALRSIPTLSIVTDPDALFGTTGLYENSTERGDAWERAASAEWILPDGSTAFAEDCGLRVHGYGWRYHSNTKKHSFRLEFSREYGAPKLEYPIFPDAPVDRFDSIVLRAGGSKTWLDFRDPAQAQYLHDSFARDTARDMGKLDGHATYVHLYLNGLYWGLYNPVERPEAGFGEEYLGGDADEYDAINRRTSTNEAVDGTLDAYNELLARAEADLTDASAYAAVEEMLDLDALIDYMLINQYTVNRDGPCCFESNNMRGLRRRVDGEQFRFFVWDMEYSLWGASDDGFVDIDVAGSISHVYTRLRDNADFRARFAARAREHLEGEGALTPAKAAARYEARADEIYAALLAESARWGDTYRTVPYTRDVEWQIEYDRLMTEFFPERTAALIDQLTAAGLYE